MHFDEEGSYVGYLHRIGTQRRLYNRMRRQTKRLQVRSATNVAAEKQ
jgi:hypothetical protein